MSLEAVASQLNEAEPGSVNPDKWWLINRYDRDWDAAAVVEESNALIRGLSSLSGKDLLAKIFNSRVIAAKNSSKVMMREACHRALLETEKVGELPKGLLARVLLFSDWNGLSEGIQGMLENMYGKAVADDLRVVPVNRVHQINMDSCGEMEGRMLDSRRHIVFGKRMVQKLFGVDACISDRMIVFKDGNVVIPYVWYMPDTYFCETMQVEATGEIYQPLNFPILGLQVIRYSPAFPNDEGWDSIKHELGFKNLHSNLPSLVNGLLEKL